MGVTGLGGSGETYFQGRCQYRLYMHYDMYMNDLLAECSPVLAISCSC